MSQLRQILATRAKKRSALRRGLLRTRNEDIPEGRRIEFRIGVNLGDVIVQDDDDFGAGG